MGEAKEVVEDEYFVQHLCSSVCLYSKYAFRSCDARRAPTQTCARRNLFHMTPFALCAAPLLIHQRPCSPSRSADSVSCLGEPLLALLAVEYASHSSTPWRLPSPLAPSSNSSSLTGPLGMRPSPLGRPPRSVIRSRLDHSPQLVTRPQIHLPLDRLPMTSSLSRLLASIKFHCSLAGGSWIRSGLATRLPWLRHPVMHLLLWYPLHPTCDQAHSTHLATRMATLLHVGLTMECRSLREPIGFAPFEHDLIYNLACPEFGIVPYCDAAALLAWFEYDHCSNRLD